MQRKDVSTMATSHKKLAEIVVRYIEFLELAVDEQLDPHAAVKELESIAAEL
jgi:hypothetical protein